MASPYQWQRVIGGLSGMSSIGTGAFAAHGFSKRSDSEVYKNVFETGSRYHLLHSALLLAVPSICGGASTRAATVSGTFLTVGMMLFSGSCYTVGLLEDRKYGAAAPIGGFSLMAGWLSLALLRK